MYRKVRTTPGPVHDLAAFQARVAAGDFYPMVSSAVEPVTRVYECTKREAYQAIQRIVCALTPQHYAPSIIMNNGAPADEYGIVIEDNGRSGPCVRPQLEGVMTTTTAKRCSACGEGVFVATDVRGKAFAYREERALVLPESLTLPVCTACGEMRLSHADVERLDAALEPAYVAQRAATARGFVESLVQSGWRQVDIEHAMGLSQGYISKVIRAEKTFGMAHLHYLYLLAKHPRATISQLAPAFPEIRELEESLVRRGALATS